jgi:hypothetical protein
MLEGYFAFVSWQWSSFQNAVKKNTKKSTPNIIANIRHAVVYECDFLRWRKKNWNCSDGGDFGNNKYKQGCGGACSGAWRIQMWQGAVFSSQAVGFVLVLLVRN